MRYQHFGGGINCGEMDSCTLNHPPRPLEIHIKRTRLKPLPRDKSERPGEGRSGGGGGGPGSPLGLPSGGPALPRRLPHLPARSPAWRPAHAPGASPSNRRNTGAGRCCVIAPGRRGRWVSGRGGRVAAAIPGRVTGRVAGGSPVGVAVGGRWCPAGAAGGGR